MCLRLACVPSPYFGEDAATFSSAWGWGNSALTASLIGDWVLLAGVAPFVGGWNRQAERCV